VQTLPTSCARIPATLNGALVFHGGELLAAYMFDDVGTLRAKVSQLETHGVQEQQREAV